MIWLSAVDNALAGAIVTSKARQDIEHSDILKSADVTQSRPMQAISAVSNAPSNFLRPLQCVISKLEVFVHVVYKTSKVSFPELFSVALRVN